MLKRIAECWYRICADNYVATRIIGVGIIVQFWSVVAIFL
jgi:hypothetical protein